MDVRTRNFTLLSTILGAAAIALWFGESDAAARAEAAEGRVNELIRRAVDAESKTQTHDREAKALSTAAREAIAAATAAKTRIADLETQLAAATGKAKELEAKFADNEKVRGEAAARINELTADLEAAATAVAELNAKVQALTAED
jgi:chromosome segregation ATPase